MVNYNILYDTGTGRILNANLATITPIPVGFAVLVKDVPEASNLWNKRIEISNLKLVNKNTLELESDPTVSIATVNTMTFTKRDGETQELKGEVSDNDPVVVSAREGDLTHSPLEKSFFDTLATALVSGAGQVKLASALAPGTQTLVVHNDDLKPLFKTLTFV
jgi:hypothetical protein